MTLSIMILSTKGLVTVTQHKCHWAKVTLSITMLCLVLSVVMLSVMFYSLLCWVSLCWVSWRHKCTPKDKTRLKMFPLNKGSSLLRRNSNYDKTQFVKLVLSKSTCAEKRQRQFISPTGVAIIKLFFVLNLWIFVLASVCKARIDKLAKEKHSSLLRKFVNYGQKGFITLGPGSHKT
jgi:hypothetical protein